MGARTVRKLFAGISSWKRGSERAPHKPLLLLLAVSDCYHRKDRLQPFRDMDARLKPLLIEFGPCRRTLHTEYPFWRLQNDGLWEVVADAPLKRRQGQTDAKKSELLRHNAVGGLLSPIYCELTAHPSLIDDVATDLLRANFPSSLHGEIRGAVGLPPLGDTLTSQPRDPRFRADVIRAYQHRCAVCGFGVRLENADLAIDAAHIQWHQANGPDTVGNGLCLCALHHRLFDRGAISITDESPPRIMLSEHVNGIAGLEELLGKYHGKPLLGPQSKDYAPAPQFIRWHQREVFHAPHRPFDA